MKKNIKIMLRIFNYVKKYIKLVLICFVFSIFISLFHFSSLGIIKPIGDILFGDNTDFLLKNIEKLGYYGKEIASFLKENIFSNKYTTLYTLMILALFMVLIKNILRFFQEYITGYLTNKIIIDISNDLFIKVESLPAKYFTKEGSSHISSKFVNDIPLMAKGLKSIFNKAIREPLKALGSLVLAFMINWKLTLISITVFPLAGVFIKKLGEKVKKGAKKTLAKQSQIISLLNESFNGIKIVKAYQMENILSQKFKKANENLLKYQMKVVSADALTSPLMETFVTAVGVGMLILSAHLVMKGYMTKGDFCAFYAALGSMFDPIRKLADLNNRLNACVAAGERVFELMDTLPEVKQEDESYLINIEKIKEGIVFKNVSFSYENGKEDVLKNVSFEVKLNEKIAIIGKSGSGKTTLISLLLRLYDTNRGEILIDGINIQNITLKSLRNQIGLVTQEPILFNDTILFNITAGREVKDISLVKKAAEDAYISEDIEKLPNGYYTIYGPGGIELSGGQKQRIALARAIFKVPSILILDEALANLDSESESYILKSLEKLCKNRITFIIAHRFSTLEIVDKILVLKEGKVENFGKKSDLLKQSETFKNLYNLQKLE